MCRLVINLRVDHKNQIRHSTGTEHRSLKLYRNGIKRVIMVLVIIIQSFGICSALCDRSPTKLINKMKMKARIRGIINIPTSLSMFRCGTNTDLVCTRGKNLNILACCFWASFWWFDCGSLNKQPPLCSSAPPPGTCICSGGSRHTSAFTWRIAFPRQNIYP